MKCSVCEQDESPYLEEMGTSTAGLHIGCLYWARDMAVNWLVELGNGDYDRNMQDVRIAEFVKLYEAIRYSVFTGGIGGLLTFIGMNYFLVRGFLHEEEIDAYYRSQDGN